MLSEIKEIMRGNVLVLTVCSTLWRVSVDIIWPYLSLYVIALGGKYETIGQVMAIGNLASMILYPLGGYIADFHGRIKIMAYMTYIYALTFLIFVFSNTWQWIGVGMFFASLVTFYMPAMQALMADSIPSDKRGIGFAATFAIPGAFGVASPLIGGWLIDAYGIVPAVKGLYFVGFIVALIVATLRLKFLKETVEKTDNSFKFTVSGIPSLLLDAYTDVYETIRTAPRFLVKFSLLVSACTFFVSMAGPFWIIRSTEIIGLNTKDWGTLSLIVGSIHVFLSIPAGRLVDRFNKRKVAGLSLIACAIPTVLFLWAQNFVHVVILMVICTIPNTFINPAFQAMFIDITPPDKRGRIIAAFGGGGIWITGGAWGTGILAMISITLGSLVSGYVYRFNQSLPWFILSGSLVVLGVLIILLVDEKTPASNLN